MDSRDQHLRRVEFTRWNLVKSKGVMLLWPFAACIQQMSKCILWSACWHANAVSWQHHPHDSTPEMICRLSKPISNPCRIWWSLLILVTRLLDAGGMKGSEVKCNHTYMLFGILCIPSIISYKRLNVFLFCNVRCISYAYLCWLIGVIWYLHMDARDFSRWFHNLSIWRLNCTI